MVNREQRRKAARRRPTILEQEVARLTAERERLLGEAAHNMVRTVKTQNKIRAVERADR